MFVSQVRTSDKENMYIIKKVKFINKNVVFVVFDQIMENRKMYLFIVRMVEISSIMVDRRNW